MKKELSLEDLLFEADFGSDSLSNIENDQPNPEQKPDIADSLFKGKPLVIISSRSPEARAMEKEIYELVVKAYSTTLGAGQSHGNVGSSSDLRKYDKWILIDTDGDDKPNAVVCALKTRNGSYKLGVFAAENMQMLLKAMGVGKFLLKTANYWAEVPAMFASRLKGEGFNMVNDEMEVMMLLGGRVGGGFEWLGQYKNYNGDGYYKRNFFGKDDVRAVIGNTGSTVKRIQNFLKK